MAKTVLVVDDSAIARGMISFALIDAGYEVISAAHGGDALNKLSIAPADLVITNLDMPVMNGIEFMKQFRSNPRYKDTPAIMLTTAAQAFRRQERRLAGASGWLVKPVSANYLTLVVDAFLRHRP